MSDVTTELQDSVPPETTYTSEQIQQAKDFIWQLMADLNKDQVVKMSACKNFEETGLDVEQAIVGFHFIPQGSNHVATKTLIGFQYYPTIDPRNP